MEQAWKRQLTSPDRMLSQWRTGLREGWLPAPVLNSTVVETGEQFLLTPLDLPPGWRTRLFHDVYPGYDLPVVTAARLSATFPWVSPIAQARGQEGSPPKGFRQLHLADGGYYDNFGVVTAVNWLRSLLPSHLDDLRQRGVLLVLIRAFPEAAEPRAGGGSARARQGWLFATAGPLLTMYNVRTSTQAFHNNAEVGLLKELLGARLRREARHRDLRAGKEGAALLAAHRRRAPGDPERLGRAAEPGVAGGGEGAVPGGAVG